MDLLTDTSLLYIGLGSILELHSNSMEENELNISTAASIVVDEDRLARLENMMEMIVNQMTKDAPNNLQESFAGGHFVDNDTNPLRKRDVRRSSRLLHEIKQQSPPVSTLTTTVAVPKRFETKAVQKTVNYLTLRQFQKEYAVFAADPGSFGQTTLIWNDYYMQPTTRSRVYRRLEQFNNIYLDSQLLQKLHPKWTLPLESDRSGSKR